MKKSTPDTTSEISHHWYRKRNIWIDIAVIVIVVIIIAVIWWVGHRPEAETKSDVPQYSGQQLVDEVNLRIAGNDYAGAIKLVKGQKNGNDPNVQLLLASAYSNKDDYTSALKIYKNLENQGKLNATNTAAAADMAVKANDKQAAIELYKKAIQRVQGDSSISPDMAGVYQLQLTELEKQ
jgi:tetratricopeptide (TPR) repeat protein